MMTAKNQSVGAQSGNRWPSNSICLDAPVIPTFRDFPHFAMELKMDQLSFNFDSFASINAVVDIEPTWPAKTSAKLLERQAAVPTLAPVVERKAELHKVEVDAVEPPDELAIPLEDGNPKGAARDATAIQPAAPAATHSPQWTGAFPSFADALAFIDTVPNLRSSKRRDLRSALISAAKVLGQQPRDIRLNLKALSNTTIAEVPKLRERQVKRRRNILSGLNKVAALMGIAQPHRAGPDGLLPEWLEVTRRLESKYDRYRLARLVRNCSDRGLKPADVKTAMFKAFDEDLAASAIISKRTTYLRRICNIWADLADRYPDLGLQLLSPPVGKARLTLPLERFSPSFGEELERLKAAMRPDDLSSMYDDLELPTTERPYRPHQPMKSSTVALRIDQLRYAASALVHSGHPPNEIAGLSDLFTPIDRVKTMIRHLRERGANTRSSHVAGVIDALRHAARFCQADTTILAELTRLRVVVEPKNEGVVPRNRERLRAMVEPGTRAIVLALPELLMEDARKCSDPLDSARMVRVAVALELLTVAAPRLENLNWLNLEGSLRRAANGKRRITHIIVDEADVKNGVPIERQLPTETVDLIEEWLAKYRPLLARPENPWLFPGTTEKPLCKSHLRNWITRAIRDYAKVEVHPHLFRHFCAWLHLQYHPGDYEGVRRLLGHKRIETAIKSYIAFEQDVAAARYDQTVLKERRATRLVARQMLSRRAPSGLKNNGKANGNAKMR